MDRDRSSYSRTFFIGASRGAATWGWLLAGSLRLRLPAGAAGIAPTMVDPGAARPERAVTPGPPPTRLGPWQRLGLPGADS